ncbi:indolepyruvate ferredoxin oxidoreductase subunit alpha [Desulfurococcus amylolyticus]|uniref:indolepyruvate ferredoxin oxidoreductase subunit alpha n=1 Tax=Desulfurococcus amylolyticus TaxID=94694 RepID=UPI0005B1FCEF|nr:indolepyruvate ferredoxin oxidoreductase subunit alpha [Desulfurococcus amylolyticus]
MSSLNPLKALPGTKLALMGNEAIARGAVEAGVYVVTGYPGTPSSEVIMTIQRYGGDLGIYVEWAVNERVAFEIALGAAISGARALATMKAPGLNVASDPVISAAYSGVDGGLVILVADDPGPHTTQTEQDDRWFAKLAKLPTISPSSPQEAKDYARVAFEISEELMLPVMLLTTTRVNHAVGEVILGEFKEPRRYKGFKRDPPRYVRAGMKWNLERHKWVDQQLSRVEEVTGKHGLNRVEGSGDLCIVTGGAAYNYVVEAVESLGLSGMTRILKLGLIHPLPARFILENIEGCRKILVVEELDPFIEEELAKMLYRAGLHIEILGKHAGWLPFEGELNPVIVREFIARATGVRETGGAEPVKPGVEIPERPPPLCPGCPHRFTFIALRSALLRNGFKPSDIPVFGDIGCYALSVNPPLNSIWTEHSMGASISMAMGLKIAGFEKPVVAVIGDSTFFHAGIPSLIEAVHKRVDMLVLILDNDIVAMTGHQSTPAWSRTETGRETRGISILELVKAIGVDNVAVVDPYNLKEAERIIGEYLVRKGVNVVIAKHPCALEERRTKHVEPYVVDAEKCTGCRACIASTGCPAIIMVEGKAYIIEEDCNGCGLCVRYCQYNAIVRRER